MKFITVFLALGLTISAEPINLQKRQSSTPIATQTLTTIANKLTEMDLAIRKFSWKGSEQDAIDAVPILDKATEILKTMRDGTSQIKAAPVLGLVDTIGILGPLMTLTTSVNSVTGDLKKKKSDFESAALLSVVIDQLENFDSAAKALVKETLDKLPLPTSLTGVFSQPILTALGDTLKEFGGKESATLPDVAPAPQPKSSGKGAPKAKGGRRPGNRR